ncbi:dihydrofolate reductase family protein [Microbacterium aurantiacum]|uniref:Deaminase/reductase n=1 Tax=Microbacterium aurantiacum TaxID=162393 RepID=A0A0M9VMK4_9MICO|nr:dihydrofolate reductase family protein [Microbacterium chocolatum]ANG86589.1 deaminase [Microbacterium chocolatum]KOS12369.1 deaminase/reductase [Microbacterium chocolatum]
MPARFVYWMNVSLDLFIEHAHDEQGGGDWMSIDDELHAVFNARAEALTMMVQGRRVFETMETFWPAARDNVEFPQVYRDYGRIWTDKPKILVSRARIEAPHNTTVFGGDDAIARLGEVRASESGDIGVGGAGIATQLLAAGLLDEVLLFTHPVILGSGRPLFDGLTSPVRLELLEQATYSGGVTMHRYAVGDA